MNCVTLSVKLVCIVALLQAGNPRKCGSISGRGKRFFSSPKHSDGSGATQHPLQQVSGSPRSCVKRPWLDHSRSFGVEVKTAWIITGKYEGKWTVVPAHAMKTYMESIGILPLILILGTRWRGLGSFTSRPLCPPPSPPENEPRYSVWR